VTACALHKDGRRLAVLTYSGIWIFTRAGDGDRFLSGTRQRIAFPHWSLQQVEGLAWSGEEELMVINEQRDMFRIPMTAFVPVD
jgi:hypothetical protein